MNRRLLPACIFLLGLLVSGVAFIVNQAGIFNVGPLVIISAVISIAGIISDMVMHVRPEEPTVKVVTPSARPHDLPPVVRGLLNLALSDRDRDNIIGDLSEAYLEFSSKLKADLWLYKQVLRSLLPLAYKGLKGRLASLFGVRAR